MKKTVSILSAVIVILVIALTIVSYRLIQAQQPPEKVVVETTVAATTEATEPERILELAVDDTGYSVDSSVYAQRLTDVMNAVYPAHFPFNMNAAIQEEDQGDGFDTYVMDVSGSSFMFTLTNAGDNTNLTESDKDERFDLVGVMGPVSSDEDLYTFVGVSEAVAILASPEHSNHETASKLIKQLLETPGQWQQFPPMEYSIHLINGDTADTSILLFTAREIEAFVEK